MTLCCRECKTIIPVAVCSGNHGKEVSCPRCSAVYWVVVELRRPADKKRMEELK